MSSSAGLAAAMPLRGLQFETGQNLPASPCGCHLSWRAATSKKVPGGSSALSTSTSCRVGKRGNGIQNGSSQPASRHPKAPKAPKAPSIGASVATHFSKRIFRFGRGVSADVTTRVTAEAAKGVSAASEEAIPKSDVVIVGAGLAGLSAARTLYQAGVSFVLFEASDEYGGRVRTDNVDGFLLDRGFQIFLSAYPECARQLDYPLLDLQPFYAGAAVWHNGAFHRIADPFRHPLDGVKSLANPIGSVADKVRVGLLRFKALTKSVDRIFEEEEESIEARLRREGFSEEMVDRFFRPFLGGIFFDRQLRTSSRLLTFVLRMLALGSNTLPAGGIKQVPKQLADSLPRGCIHLNSKVQSIVPGGGTQSSQILNVRSGSNPSDRTSTDHEAVRGVIIAVEGPESEKLLGKFLTDTSPSTAGTPKSTVCIYFASPSPPPPAAKEPLLFLNGTKKGIVNNMCFPSVVAPAYAPLGQTLVSVSLIGTHEGTSDEELERRVRIEASEWFGQSEIDTWRHLRTYRIAFAQPNQDPPTSQKRDVRLGRGLYVCGDHRDAATFDSAMVSGRRAAEALLEDLKVLRLRG